MIVLYGSSQKPRLIALLALLSFVYQPLSAGEGVLQTTKLSVLSLDMGRDEAVALLTEDGWQVRNNGLCPYGSLA